jgi:hypothetical protein
MAYLSQSVAQYPSTLGQQTCHVYYFVASPNFAVLTPILSLSTWLLLLRHHAIINKPEESFTILNVEIRGIFWHPLCTPCWTIGGSNEFQELQPIYWLWHTQMPPPLSTLGWQKFYSCNITQNLQFWLDPTFHLLSTRTCKSSID